MISIARRAERINCRPDGAGATNFFPINSSFIFRALNCESLLARRRRRRSLCANKAPSCESAPARGLIDRDLIFARASGGNLIGVFVALALVQPAPSASRAPNGGGRAPDDIMI